MSFFPGYSDSVQETMHGIDIGEDIPTIGWVGSVEMGVITWELFIGATAAGHPGPGP